MAGLPKSISFLIDKLYDNKVVTKGIDDLSRRDLGSLILFGYYDPKTKEKLSFWDLIPLLLVFGFNGNYLWGLNIHYIPYTYRLNFIGYLYNKRYKENKFLTWNDIKMAWKGAKIPMAYAYFSYRLYLIPRISTNIKSFGELDWKPVTVNVLPKFKKMADAAIYSYIYQQIKRKRKK